MCLIMHSFLDKFPSYKGKELTFDIVLLPAPSTIGLCRYLILQRMGIQSHQNRDDGERVSL